MLGSNQRPVVRYVLVMERIELFYWEGCPSHPEAKELLERLLVERRIDVEVELREVRTQQQPRSPAVAWHRTCLTRMRFSGRRQQ
jgi:hypothetical protein